VWALGATLYEAVAGHPPYVEQPNPFTMPATIAAGQTLPPELAGFLTEPIGRMLDPDPRSRWSMTDAADALHQLADEHPRRDTAETSTASAPSARIPAAQIPDAAVGEADPRPVATQDETWAGESRSVPDDRDGHIGGAGRIVVPIALILLALLTVAGLILLTAR
jgi:serine/threonine protein kinase